MPFYHKSLIPYYLLFGLICVLVRNHIFFWDTYQLCGKQAWALYENGLTQWILPAEIDSGHPPLFGFYHAALWKIFGTHLWVNHIAMMPFLCGIVYFYYRIGVHFLGHSNAVFLLPLLIADPVFMGQAVLASPDIVLLCFMLMVLFGILKQNNSLIFIGAIFLGLISTRGMMVLAALILFDIFTLIKGDTLRHVAWSFTRYIPAILLVFGFLLYHYFNTGWLGHHKESSWADSFSYVDFRGLLKNIAVYGWRFLDFGRFAIILSLLGITMHMSTESKDKNLDLFFTIIGFLLLIFTPVLLSYTGLLLHRYLLPVFLLFTLLFWYLLFSHPFLEKFKTWIWGLVLCSLITGNLWVYPKHISQGWDSTLGHLPYYHLRNKMISYIEENQIDLTEVGTAFPNIGPMRNYDPAVSRDGFKEYNLQKDEYIFYSNIYNDFSDQELETLSSNQWHELKSIYFYPVCVILYKRNR